MAGDPKSYDWNPYIYAAASYGLAKVIQYKVSSAVFLLFVQLFL